MQPEVVNFYPRSRQVKPHICARGELHVCISDWLKVLRTNKGGDSWVLREPLPDYPLLQDKKCT